MNVNEQHNKHICTTTTTTLSMIIFIYIYIMSHIAKIINIPRLASKYIPQNKTILLHQDKPKSRNDNNNTVRSAGISCKTFKINPISKGNREPIIHEDKLLTYSNRQRTPDMFINSNSNNIIYQFNTHQLSGHKMLSVPLRYSTRKKKISYKHSYKLLSFINDFNYLISMNVCKAYLTGSNAVSVNEMNVLMKMLNEFQCKMKSIRITKTDDDVVDDDVTVNVNDDVYVNNEVKSESDKRMQCYMKYLDMCNNAVNDIRRYHKDIKQNNKIKFNMNLNIIRYSINTTINDIDNTQKIKCSYDKEGIDVERNSVVVANKIKQSLKPKFVDELNVVTNEGDDDDNDDDEIIYNGDSINGC